VSVGRTGFLCLAKKPLNLQGGGLMQRKICCLSRREEGCCAKSRKKRKKAKVSKKGPIPRRNTAQVGLNYTMKGENSQDRVLLKVMGSWKTQQQHLIIRREGPYDGDQPRFKRNIQFPAGMEGEGVLSSEKAKRRSFLVRGGPFFAGQVSGEKKFLNRKKGREKRRQRSRTI